MTTSTMFGGAEERAKIKRWYDAFRDKLAIEATDRTLATPFGETHLLVAGPEDGRPLLALHGALASSAHFLPEIAPLARTRRIYAVDVVGQSVMSEDRRIPLDDSYGKWVIGVADGLGLDRFDLLGVSWGGFVASRAAAAAPSRIDHLVLVVPAGFVSGNAWAGFRDLGWPMLKYRMFPSDTRLESLVRALFTTMDPDWTAYFGDAIRSYKLDMRIPPLARPEDLSSVTCPTLVFGADEDLSFPGAKLLARVKELIPGAEVELLEGTKHSPSFTNAFRAQLNARIEAFLSKG
jgi:2-hydroxy-6-oxonona-2,4-dienedioate hydrolase